MASLPQPSRTPGSAPPETGPRLKETRRWVKRSDVLARVVITTGGIGIIVTVLLILVLILTESVPLWTGARGESETLVRFPTAESNPVLLAFPDAYRQTWVVLRSTGVFQQVDRKSARVIGETRVPGTEGWRITTARRVAGRDVMALGLEDGRLLVVEGRLRVDYSPRGRVVDFSVHPLADLQILPEGRPVRIAAAATRPEGTVLLASSGESDLFFGFLPAAEESEFVEPEPVAFSKPQDVSPSLFGAKVTALAIAETAEESVVGTDRGEFIAITVDADGTPVADDPVSLEPSGPAAVTAAAFLIGGQSAVFGDEKGRLSSWFRVRSADNPSLRPYTKIHRFQPMPSSVRAIGASVRNKGFVTADAAGGLWLSHNTSEQTVLKFGGRQSPAVAAGITPQDDGAFIVSENGVLASYLTKNPHPETTLKTLFGKVWYEGYEKPEFVWQSTGGTDDFEPKLSLTPLIYGTLKATFYALIFAVPTAIAAALYASLFAHRTVRRVVKPVVEIMAALPSVVIGFLAGLWLAPRVERTTVGTLLLLPVVPLVVIAGALALRAVPRATRVKLRPAAEMVLLVALVVLSVWAAYRLGPLVEGSVFGGDFKAWLFGNFQERYDPRNSLIIGFAMGFAVIPIIFTISEDAFSNVPAHLSAASLALGASRWQTATRVVVPTASPGVFSAVMIGFGRAVGETMIVLMATGNTPIMDWSIFNGMRTLSANIAVEIPEAPFGGTLYRILFFASALLFVMTFCVNTAAEVVRQRLRKKYEVI